VFIPRPEKLLLLILSSTAFRCVVGWYSVSGPESLVLFLEKVLYGENGRILLEEHLR